MNRQTMGEKVSQKFRHGIVGEYYIDTCTVIDAIEILYARYRVTAREALSRIRNEYACSEYMEDELKRVLRHKFGGREKDMLLEYYWDIKPSSFIPTDQTIGHLYSQSKNLQKQVRQHCGRRGKAPGPQDIVHVGVCGLKDIPGIVSEDWGVYGRDVQGRPFIDIVRQEISHGIQHVANPKHTFVTRGGFKRVV